MLDSNPEPKSFHETKQTQDSANWWAAMTTEFQNMNRQSLQTEKLSERDGFTPKRQMDDSEQDVLQRVSVRFPEKNFKTIMHQLYQTQHYTYS
jgi:hypothetical protein